MPHQEDARLQRRDRALKQAGRTTSRHHTGDAGLSPPGPRCGDVALDRQPLVGGPVGRVSLGVDGSAGGVDVLDDQSGQFRDELRRLFVAHALPPGQRRLRDALGEDFGVVVGVDRVLGAVDDQRW